MRARARVLTLCVCVSCLAVCKVPLTRISRVGQNHIYMVYLRYFWQGNYQIYGHIRCIYTVLANPAYMCVCGSRNVWWNVYLWLCVRVVSVCECCDVCACLFLRLDVCARVYLCALSTLHTCALMSSEATTIAIACPSSPGEHKHTLTHSLRWGSGGAQVGFLHYSCSGAQVARPGVLCHWEAL